MDTVVLDGVQYVKASVVAKQFRYTSDYIGQLCRGKKIDARLVGRTWFVNPDSVKEHKHRKHSKPEKKQKQSDDSTTPATHKVKVRVEPVVGAKTARTISTNKAAREEQRERHLKVSYERDEEALLPTIKKRKKQPPKRLQIEYADPKRVRVKGGKKKEVNFTPSKLPDVALSGKLKVDTYEEPTSENEESDSINKDKSDIPKKNKAISDKKTKVKKPKTVHLAPKLKAKASEEVDIHVFQGSVLPPEPIAKKTSASKTKDASVAMKRTSTNAVKSHSEVHSFTPKMVSESGAQSSSQSVWVRVSPLIATLVAIITVIGIFAASSQVSASGTEYRSGVVFQVANLIEMLNR